MSFGVVPAEAVSLSALVSAEDGCLCMSTHVK